MADGARPITQRWVAQHLPARSDRAHKGTFGRLLVVGGSLEYSGAVLLAGQGGLRAGAGLVCVATAESVAARMAGVVPELTWLILAEEAPGLIAPSGWRRLASESTGYDAVVIGPGLGRQPATLRRTRSLIAAVRRPTVVDADALNALAGTRTWWRGLHAPLVLTPHPVEFGRLTAGDPPPDEPAARALATREAAALWGQTVVLKGPQTLVADPGGALLRSDVATPALATAGSGDVLAGAIGALLAAGLDPFDAAACAVAIHGAAGLLAEERIGRSGVIARDVANLLPAAAERLRGDRR
jgi:hydroxyethylthiazole kinase-like uncharacterized protein yjeF